MSQPPPTRPLLRQGLGLSAGLGFFVAFVGQILVPPLAKVPGILICGGEAFELFVRRRDSYGRCGGVHTVHYAIVLVVSFIVWSVLLIPVGMALARWRARRSK